MEELKYFKLELLNREESYNKTFARQPIIGSGKVKERQMFAGKRLPVTVVY